jgi:hypothetical protein
VRRQPGWGTWRCCPSVGGARVTGPVAGGAVKPYAVQIATIWFNGNLPVIFDSNIETETRQALLRSFEQPPNTAFASVSRTQIRRMGILKYPAERRWLNTMPHHTDDIHVLLYSGEGSLLLVHSERGWCCAPGTIDGQLLD